jgi:hypothetical protein
MKIESETSGAPKAFRWLLSLILASFLLSAADSRAAVAVLDAATSVDKAVWLTVVTKGLLLAESGQRVDVSVDTQALGQILTGGDGYGYLKYTPHRPGLLQIEARSNSDTGSGLLLVTKPEDKVLLIDLEGSFQNVFFSSSEKSEAKKAIEALAEKFKIIYLTRLVGIRIASFWLQEEKFPESIVLRWPGADLLESLVKKGMTLYAIVGSPEILSDSAKYVEHRFSFEETDNGQTIGDWAELTERLKAPKDPHDDRPTEHTLIPSHDSR